MENYLNIKEISFRDYLKVFFRQKAKITAVFFTLTVLVIIILMLWTPVFEAEVKILISAEKQVEAPNFREIYGAGGQITLTQSAIVTSNPIIERAVKALHLYERPKDYEKQFCSVLKAPLVDLKIKIFDMINKILNPDLTPEQKRAYEFISTVENLKESIEVEPLMETNIFVIRVVDFSPFGAAVIANTISRSYVIFDLEQQLADSQLKYGEKHLAVMQLKDNIAKMTENLNGEPIQNNVDAIGPASVKIIEQAALPIQPKFSSLLIFVLAFFINSVLAVVSAFIFEYMDQTVRSPQDIERILNLPFLGSIPKILSKQKVLIKDIKTENAYTQSFLNISEQIYLLLKDKNLKSLLITSSLDVENAAAIIANIGFTLSEKLGHRVLLVDANFRSPSLHKILNLPEDNGLADILEEKTTFEKAVREINPNLALLNAGKTLLNPVILLDSLKMSEIIKTAKEKYEIILFNCAELRKYKDSAVLARHLDCTAMVVNEGETRYQVIQNSIISLKHKKSNIIGIILNNRVYSLPRIIYDRV